MALAYLAAAWAVGIVLAAALHLPAAVWLALFLLPAGYLLVWRHEPFARRILTLVLVLLLGALRYQLAAPAPEATGLASWNDQGAVSLIGTVVDEPDRREAYTALLVQVTQLGHDAESQSVSGRVLVQAPRDTGAQYGDALQLDGELTTPPAAADFSYRDWLARSSIFSLMPYARVRVLSHGHGDLFWTALYQIKAQALGEITNLFPEPSASLLSGILLGSDKGIPRSLRDDFNRTNTAHIIAISGFNISILALYLGLIARRLFAFRPVLGDGFVIVSLAVYTLLVGADPSVVRAAVMGCLSIIALRLGRQPFALSSLGAAAILMTALDPYALWDLGFQLSFLATLGLVLYAAPMQEWVRARVARALPAAQARQVVSFLGDSVIVTLAAWIATTPLIATVFHRLSITGLLTNFLILPAQPPIMLLGGLSVLLQLPASLLGAGSLPSLILGALAQAIAWLAYIFLQYTILIVQWSAHWPLVSIELPRIDWLFSIPAYALILLFTRFRPREIGRFLFARPELAVGALAVTTVLLWSSLLAAPDPRTHVQFVATGGGDAVLIRTANDGRILIDGTSEPSALLAHLGEQMPFWDRRLDLVIASSSDEANLASLNAVLERFDVGEVMEPPASGRGVSWQRWSELIRERDIPSVPAQPGMQLQMDEVKLEVVTPDEQAPELRVRAANIGLRLATGGKSLLLLPSLHSADLRALLESNAELGSQFAVLPSSFEKELLDRVAPQTVILFVGRSSREQPKPETLKLLEATDLLRTDERGDIELIFSGQQVVESNER